MLRSKAHSILLMEISLRLVRWAERQDLEAVMEFNSGSHFA
jgi:hypothetical protein